MNKYSIPINYFNPQTSTQNLVSLYKYINNGLNNSEINKILPTIFQNMNDNLYNIKTSLRLNPDKCADLLNSVVGSDDKFNQSIARMDVDRAIMSDTEQKSVIEKLTYSAKFLRGYIKQDSHYIKIPSSITKEERTELLKIASQTCLDSIYSITSYIQTLSQEGNMVSTRQSDISDIQKYLQKKKNESILAKVTLEEATQVTRDSSLHRVISNNTRQDRIP